MVPWRPGQRRAPRATRPQATMTKAAAMKTLVSPRRCASRPADARRRRRYPSAWLVLKMPIAAPRPSAGASRDSSDGISASSMLKLMKKISRNTDTDPSPAGTTANPTWLTNWPADGEEEEPANLPGALGPVERRHHHREGGDHHRQVDLPVLGERQVRPSPPAAPARRRRASSASGAARRCRSRAASCRGRVPCARSRSGRHRTRVLQPSPVANNRLAGRQPAVQRRPPLQTAVPGPATRRWRYRQPPAAR